VQWLKTFRESVRLLATRRFGTLWFASLLSSIGTWAQQVAEPWLLLTVGASPFLVGLDSFVADAPAWLLTIIGGELADRADRRRVIVAFQSVQLLCPLTIIILLLTRTIHPWMIVGLSLIVGVTDALSMPSFQSIVPSILERDQVGNGLALNSTQFNLSRILGPALAGVLISSVGLVACFAVNVVSYIPFIAVALWLLPRRSQVWQPQDKHHIDPNGVRHVLAQPYLRSALAVVFTSALLCSPLITFSPVLVKSEFQSGAGHYSAALVAFGVGGLLGATFLLGMSPGVDRRRLSSTFALAYGILVAGAAASPWLSALPVLLMLAGASMTISNTAANSLLQATAGPRILGRTVSLYMLAIRGGASLGAVLTGAAATLVGVRSALLFDGLAALAVQAALVSFWPQTPVPELEAAPGHEVPMNSRSTYQAR
jgi:MFS family permease